MHTAIEDFITLTREAKTVDELFHLLEREMETYGFKHTAYAILSDHPALANESPIGLILKNELNGWDEHYLENDYMSIDFCPKVAYSIPGFFSWSELISSADISPSQQTIFQQADEFKLYNGINISIHAPGGVKCVIWAAADQHNLLLTHMKDRITLIAQQFNMCFLLLMNHNVDPPSSPLSIREEDILKWSAKGLTKFEISHLLSISEHTVNYHMRNIFKKLQAKNTTEALIIAIKQGLAV